MQDVTRQFHFSGAHTSRDRASSQGKRIAPTSKTTVTAVAHKGSLAKSKPLEDILPSEKLEYNGNGFYKLMSTGKPPKLIKSDQAMMEMAVSGNEMGYMNMLPPPSHKYHDRRSGLTEICLCFEMPILILM